MFAILLSQKKRCQENKATQGSYEQGDRVVIPLVYVWRSV